MNIYVKIYRCPTIVLLAFCQIYIHTPQNIVASSTMCVGEVFKTEVRLNFRNHSSFRPVTQNLQKLRLKGEFEDAVFAAKIFRKKTCNNSLNSIFLDWSQEVQPTYGGISQTVCILYRWWNYRKIWKFWLFFANFLAKIPLKADQWKISWCTTMSIWLLTVGKREIQVNQGFCTPCRWWHCQKTWIF